jgi:hypothetical protein
MWRMGSLFETSVESLRIQRGDYEEFLQKNIEMKQMIVTKNDLVKVGLSLVAKICLMVRNARLSSFVIREPSRFTTRQNWREN